MSDRGKLGTFLKTVIDWQWNDFLKAEKDTNYTGYEAAVFALVRACAEGKLGPIRLAIDRVDGKVETPIKFEYPKIFFLYPDAETVALPPPGMSLVQIETGEPEEPEVVEEEEPITVATMTLRQTLEKMADEKRIIIELILQRKKDVENGKTTDDNEIPLVKSVITANLLRLAETSNFEAITEVFDQIDGKLVETIRVLGEDLYLTSYLAQAPYGAKQNKDGVYQLEMPQMAMEWKQKLSND